jgi:FkbM family methyltransferase
VPIKAKYDGLPPIVSGVLAHFVAQPSVPQPGEYQSSLAPFALQLEQMDYTARIFALRGFFEWRIAAIAALVLKPGDVVFEGGAQHGTETLVYSTLVGPAGKVVSFEAEAGLAARLGREVERQGRTQNVVLHEALGAEPGTAVFEPSPTEENNTGLGTLAAPGAKSANGVEVTVSTLDDAMAEHGSPQLVVMDIQGGELAALKGATRVLREARPMIVLEVESESLERLGGSAEELHQLLLDNDYVCFRFGRMGLRPVDAPHPGELGDWLIVPREIDPARLRRIRRGLAAGLVTPPRSRLNPLGRAFAARR